MGVHKRQREEENRKDNYIKKSSCYLLVVMALLAGAFIGNTITMLYMGQQRPMQQQANVPQKKQSSAPTADASRLAELEAEAAANPTDFDAWSKLGHYCFDNGLPAKAIVAYKRAIELRPMHVGVWSDLGVMYRRTDQFDKAIDAFQHAASLDPKHIVSRFNMGIVYLHDLNDREAAAKAWKEVLALDPNAKAPNGQPLSELVKGLGL
ncbi:conserved protein of unknown function [Pseudodesulfovibrio profundus]|uniref:Uncharacterized protein n=1 Tax=Pseudodesulfovibrio profundus TaxID=57320 RepID=A0A2C8F6M9_9BACT|nr:tetratricopeptide repeat protein [Pseudodesulfovibrio profundus]SOB57688.1 conserved protein of unknown function [Pseudodesulfovibrio profundus]|tara:strand:- start:73 stop:696 length:624 start_codon:yes stop_codon:yes gene_type:complete